jgi:hypothetical protein
VRWKIINVSSRSLWDRIQGVEEGIHGLFILPFNLYLFNDDESIDGGMYTTANPNRGDGYISVERMD